MGVGTKNDGKIVIIDNKEVKKSNLNRNFLFKNEDIGRKKSSMKKTNQFTSSFYENIDGIISTIYDNNLNYYISDECTFYTKPFVVAETFGMKGFYQTIVPRITNTYEKKNRFFSNT